MQQADIFGLAGHATLIIGAGQGIGEATARLLARLGSGLALVDIEAERLEQLAQECRAMGVTVSTHVIDILDPANHAGLLADAEAAHPRLDRLVTIVGGAAYAPLQEIGPQGWLQAYQLNLGYIAVLAPLFAAKIGAGGGGAMAFVSSVNGIQAAPNHAAYGAAKAGLIHLVQTMAVEWASLGIRVNSVAPGLINTPRRPAATDRIAAIARSNIPFGRHGKPEDIANALAFLISDMAAYVTGQSLAVDGGWTGANLLLGPKGFS